MAVILQAFSNDSIKEKHEGPTKLDLISQRLKEVCCCRNVKKEEEDQAQSEEDDSDNSEYSEESSESGVESEVESQIGERQDEDRKVHSEGELLQNEERKKKKKHRRKESDSDSARGSSPETANVNDQKNRPGITVI